MSDEEVTLDDIIDAIKRMTEKDFSQEEIDKAYLRLNTAVALLLKPSEKARKASELMGISLIDANIQMNKINKIIDKHKVDEYEEEDPVDRVMTGMNQRATDLSINRKKAKEKGIKVWTGKEIEEEYTRTGKDCNYMPLELVGKPSYWVSPCCGALYGEYVKVSDVSG